MVEKEKDKPSWLFISTLLTASIILFIWNFVCYCTPMKAFNSWTPPKGIQRSFFPLIRIYYSVVCLLFWVIPFILMVKSINLIVKKCF